MGADVKITAEFESGSIMAGLNETARSVNTKATEMSKSLSDKIKEGVEKSKESLGEIGKIAGGFLLGGGIMGAIGGIGSAFETLFEKGKEFEELKEKSTIAFQSIGMSAEQAAHSTEILTKQSTALADKFAIDRNAVIQATQAYLSFGGSTDNLAGKQEVIIGLAQRLQAKGMDMASAMNQAAVMMAKAGSPEATMGLQRLGIQIPTTATEAERFAIMSKAAAGGIAGLAEAANSPLGNLKKLQNSIGDIVSEVGGKLVDAIGSAVGWLMKGFTQAWNVLKPVLTGLWTIIKEDVVIQFNILKAIIFEVWTVIKTGYDVISGIVGWFLKLFQSTDKGQQSVGIFKQIWDGLVFGFQNFDKIAAGVVGALDAVMDTISKAGDGIAEFVHGLATMNFSEVKEGFGKVKDAASGIGTAMAEGFNKGWNDAANTPKETEETIAGGFAGEAGEKNQKKPKKDHDKEIDDARKLLKAKFAAEDTEIETAMLNQKATADEIAETMLIQKKNHADEELKFEDDALNKLQEKYDAASGKEKKALQSKLATQQQIKEQAALAAARAEAEIEKAQAKDNEAAKKAAEEKIKKIDEDASKLAERLDKQRTARETQDEKNKLDLMRDGMDKELAIEQSRYQKEYDLAVENGANLELVEQLHQQKMADIRAKADVAAKASYDSLMAGAGSVVNTGLQKIQDNFAKSFHNSNSVVAQAAQAMVGSLAQSFSQAILSGDGFIAKNLAVAGSAIVSAAASVFSFFASIPFVGIPLGIAAVGTVIAEFGNIKKALGFATGGLAMVGEGGQPEVIAPVKDFSHMMEMVASKTVEAIQTGANSRAMQGGSRASSSEMKDLIAAVNKSADKIAAAKADITLHPKDNSTTKISGSDIEIAQQRSWHTTAQVTA